MPPCAAFECERTGWTLAMIPTDAPSSAAASAARCPASPPPITSTSCEGMKASILLGPGSGGAGFYATVADGPYQRYGRPFAGCSSRPREGLQRPHHLLDGDDA